LTSAVSVLSADDSVRLYTCGKEGG